SVPVMFWISWAWRSISAAFASIFFVRSASLDDDVDAVPEALPVCGISHPETMGASRRNSASHDPCRVRLLSIDTLLREEVLLQIFENSPGRRVTQEPRSRRLPLRHHWIQRQTAPVSRRWKFHPSTSVAAPCSRGGGTPSRRSCGRAQEPVPRPGDP